MTHQEAKSIARHLGLTLRKVRSGDYRVNFREGKESTAYYTDTLEDAVRAAIEMARTRGEARPHRVSSPEQRAKSNKSCTDAKRPRSRSKAP
jgi:hypothetical protein